MKRITTTQLRRKPRDGERIVMVTCYDATFARLVDEANVDVILLGDALGMRVTVEGVESEQQHDLLAQEACDEIQGYHISSPRPAFDVPQLLARSRPTGKARAM